MKEVIDKIENDLDMVMSSLQNEFNAIDVRIANLNADFFSGIMKEVIKSEIGDKEEVFKQYFDENFSQLKMQLHHS